MATPELVAQIERATSNGRVRLAMMLGALLEGGSLTGPWSAGDSGQSWGPYQIHSPAHPEVTRAQAENPAFAVRYMLASYEHGVRQVSDDLWETNPALAAAQAAFVAEQPAYMYPQARIAGAWSTLQQSQDDGDGGRDWRILLPGLPDIPLPDLPFDTGGDIYEGTIGAAKSTAEVISGIGGWILDASNWWRLGAILAGAALIGAGLLIYTRSATLPIIRDASKLAATAAV